MAACGTALDGPRPSAWVVDPLAGVGSTGGDAEVDAGVEAEADAGPWNGSSATLLLDPTDIASQQQVTSRAE